MIRETGTRFDPPAADGTSWHPPQAESPSIRERVCFINLAFTHGKLCVLPREVVRLLPIPIMPLKNILHASFLYVILYKNNN